jgi:hypothetical protein
MTTIELALFFQTLLWAIVIGVFLASGQASLFHPLTIYLGFHGLVFVLRPWLVYSLHFDTIWRYMHMYPEEHDLKMTLAVTSLALISFSTSSMLVGRTVLDFKSKELKPFTLAEKQALLITTLLLGPLVAYSIHSYTHGGMQGEHVGGTYILTGASGYTLEAQFMAGPLICAWMTVMRFSPKAMLFLLPYIGYRAYAGIDRWTIVLLVMALSTIYAWQKRTRWMPVWSVIVAVPLYLLFHAMGENRGFVTAMLNGEPVEKTDAPLGREEAVKLKYDTQEFANFDFLCYVIKMVPERTGTYTYGVQYLQIFTEPIPRKLWPGKPAGAPVAFFNLNNYGNFLGLTPSLAGDGWMSGGWLGVMITLILVGGVLGLAHRWFWRNVQSNMSALVYSFTISMLPQWYRDGGISIAKFLFWNLSPLIIWFFLTWVIKGARVCGPSVWLRPGSPVRFVYSEKSASGK